jgi:glycosyltransferase involved in cell wall biosynthesis
MKYGRRIRCFIQYIRHEDIPKFFITADVVVLPYVEFHSQSGVLHLAQGFGKPVIVTDVGGLPEAVNHEETGLVVPAGNVERLAEAIMHLMTHENLRRQMGQRAKEMAVASFSWKAIADTTIEKAYKV